MKHENMKHEIARWLVLMLLVPAAAFAQESVGVDDDAATTQATTRPSRLSRRIDRNPPNVVDLLTHTETADDFSEGATQNVNVIADAPARIQLGYRENMFPRDGTWTGPEVRTKFDFNELLASFNPHCPPECGVILEVRVRQKDQWSPWLFMQSWGKVVMPPKRVTDFDGGDVDIDFIVLKSPGNAYQARITLTSFDFDVRQSPSVRRLSISYTGVVDDTKKREKLAPPTTAPSGWARSLDVPFRGQGAAVIPKPLRGMICSPTSTSMVMEFLGVNCTTVENAMAIYDPQYDMFGNWGRSVSRASEMGLDGWLQRFRNWEQVKAFIAEGTPVITSIRFRPGQVKGFLYESTAGHLLVIRGFTSSGDVIVNDPANKEKGGGAVYPAAEFAKAWFDNGGVGYVIRKPASALPSALVKTAPTTSPATTAPVATSSR